MLAFFLFAAQAFALPASHPSPSPPPSPRTGMSVRHSETETALFAGGHFWSVQRTFDRYRRQGVILTTTGYSGGRTERPTFALVEKGNTGHRQAVQVVFDPAKIRFAKLVEIFLRRTDPFDGNGQFCDRGDRYRPTIYFESESQRRDAEAVIQRLEKQLGKGKFATELLPALSFHAAEARNQEFYNSNPVSYKLYDFGCGRDERLSTVWGGKE